MGCHTRLEKGHKSFPKITRGKIGNQILLGGQMFLTVHTVFSPFPVLWKLFFCEHIQSNGLLNDPVNTIMLATISTAPMLSPPNNFFSLAFEFLFNNFQYFASFCLVFLVLLSRDPNGFQQLMQGCTVHFFFTKKLYYFLYIYRYVCVCVTLNWMK